MSKARLSRENLLPLLAAHVLEHGLAGVSLRPLARAVGTSDRMLLYHFGSKERLISDLLEYLSATYAEALDNAFPHGRAADRKACIAQVLAVVRTPPFAPFMRLWWEIVAGAASGEQAYQAAAHKMLARLLQWFEEHMPEGDPDPKGGARLLFTLIEGTLMLDSLGHGKIADEGLAAAEL